MSSMRRTRAWHECLHVLKPVWKKKEGDQNAAFAAGKQTHEIIQRMHPEFKAENAGKFTDEALPFDITFHADMYDEKNQIVWEIKPANWFVRNIDYCITQASGYKHFLNARSVQFLLYRLHHSNGKRQIDNVQAEDIEGPWPYNPPFIVDWPKLREYSLLSDARLNLPVDTFKSPRRRRVMR